MTTVEQTASALSAQARPTDDSDRSRFMQYVDVTSSKRGCWLWTGGTIGAAGYGTFHYRQRPMPAHRASFLLFNGPLAKGLFVMHACDDRQCVNPKHLSLGTPKENSQDMVRKNRAARGSKNGCAITDEKTVAKIRGEYIERHGELTRLADKYGLKLSTVSAIISGQNWRHVETELGSAPSADAPRKQKQHGEKHHRAKLTEEQVREMRTLYEFGEIELDDIVERFGVQKAQASAIVRRKAWTHVT